MGDAPRLTPARALDALVARIGHARGIAAEDLADALSRARDDDVTHAVTGALVDLAIRAATPTVDDLAALGALAEACAGLTIHRDANRIEVRGSAGRRTTGTHFTPPSLALAVARRALLPHLEATPSSDAILALRVADPAMGAGAFLLAALDVLGDALAAAWQREGVARSRVDARRAVATTCLFGIDKSALAARVARHSVAIAAHLDARSEATLDAALVVGDALVGLGPRDLDDVPRARDVDAILAADVLVGAFFACVEAPARAREADARRALLERWAERRSDADTAKLRSMQREARAIASPFHAELTWPRMHVILGNPPFLGGKRISTELGATFADWARSRTGSTKNADLAAHFLRRADAIAADAATIGFITTNSVAEGATRRSGLSALVDERGYRIYAATKSAPWPGDAAVFVSILHLARGVETPRPELDGVAVDAIDSRLQSGRERDDPARLAASTGVCFIGCFLRGRGFVLDDGGRAALVANASDRERQAVRAFLGGEEVNTSPRQSPHRWVIDLAHLGATAGTTTFDEARAMPALLGHLEREVRPERLALPAVRANAPHRARWWLFANARPELRRALHGLRRCLVIPRVSPRLNVAFQPTDRVFSDQLCVFALDGDGAFAVLQSRVHEAWARRHASTLGQGLRYTPSTCLETFPFPFEDPRVTTPSLDRAGRALEERRAALLVDLGVGLTALGRRLADPLDRDARIDELRGLGRDVDRAVLDAYGWQDLPVDAPDNRLVERLLDLNRRCQPEAAKRRRVARGPGEVSEASRATNHARQRG